MILAVSRFARSCAYDPDETQTVARTAETCFKKKGDKR